MEIVEKIGMPAALGQLAEEAAELAQAALKMQRILMGTNPTPLTLEEARANLIEESVDVDLCLTEIEKADKMIRFDPTIYAEKEARWCSRLEAQTVCNEDGCRIVYQEEEKIMIGLIFLVLVMIAFLLVFARLCVEDKKKTDWLILNGEVSRNFLPRGTRVMICGARVKNERVCGRVGVVLGGVGGNLSVLYKIDGERIEEILPRKDIIYCIRVYSDEMLQKEIDGHADGWWEDPMKHDEEENNAE